MSNTQTATNKVATKTSPLNNLLTAAPVTETPVTETPVTETPVTETPVTETPAPVKKQPTKRTVRRRERNKAGKIRLLNFTAVFKDVRANDFGLPNRVKDSHIFGKERQIKTICLNLCSESLKDRADKNFYFNRFPKLVTDLNYLKSFMTEKQIKEIDLKVWSNMQIIDLIVKGLTAVESSIKKS